MSWKDDVSKLYEDVPESERLQVFNEDMIAAVGGGIVIALREGNAIRYIHKDHATPAQLEAAMTPDDLAKALQS